MTGFGFLTSLFWFWTSPFLGLRDHPVVRDDQRPDLRLVEVVGRPAHRRGDGGHGHGCQEPQSSEGGDGLGIFISIFSFDLIWFIYIYILYIHTILIFEIILQIFRSIFIFYVFVQLEFERPMLWPEPGESASCLASGKVPVHRWYFSQPVERHNWKATTCDSLWTFGAKFDGFDEFHGFGWFNHGVHEFEEVVRILPQTVGKRAACRIWLKAWNHLWSKEMT